MSRRFPRSWPTHRGKARHPRWRRQPAEAPEPSFEAIARELVHEGKATVAILDHPESFVPRKRPR